VHGGRQGVNATLSIKGKTEMGGRDSFFYDNTEYTQQIRMTSFFKHFLMRCVTHIQHHALHYLVSLTVVIAAVPASAQSWSSIPPAYPKDYAQTIDAARKEGKLIVYSTTDIKAAEPLIKDFNTLYPAINIEYNEMKTIDVFNRFVSETASGSVTADVLWSSAMDLQIQLVSDGLALAYRSPETSAMPTWSIWKDAAYGTTYEPVVFVYNKRHVVGGDIPKTHVEFARLLSSQRDKYRNKVVTYDVEKSGLGFMFFTQDLRENLGVWDLVKTMGSVGVGLQISTATMMEKISSGESLIGYNVLGSYAMVRAKKDPSLGVSVPTDYALVLSRVMFIAKGAPNVNAAKLWLDYILSKRGQSVIANESQLFSIRPDVIGETTFATLTRQYGSVLKPIPVSPLLLQYQDPSKRRNLLIQWKSVAKRP
jgi:iron(III) transport system substrate-binding protein